MSVVVTGARGQVGVELLRALAARQLPHHGFDLPELDISDAQQIAAQITPLAPRLLINLAAYTAVDRAESEPEQAHAANALGPQRLAEYCREHATALIHVSTDYVFDGRKGAPYNEADTPNPINVYGKTKWNGEQAVRDTLAPHLILRTSWVFGQHGHNFVKTMLRLARERGELRVVADQFGCPTPATAIAEALAELAQRFERNGTLPWGTYHYAGQPATSWHGFAQAIVAAKQLDVPVQQLTSEQFPTPAARPRDTRLSTERSTTALALDVPDWRAELPGIEE